MENKKILNVCLLSLALAAIILFAVPVEKVGEIERVTVRIFYYFTNIVMCVVLAAVVFVAIYNLFKNNYSLTKLMEVLMLTAFFMNLANLLMFASSAEVQITFWYMVLALINFAAGIFSNAANAVSERKELAGQVKSLVTPPKRSMQKQANEPKKENKQQ